MTWEHGVSNVLELTAKDARPTAEEISRGGTGMVVLGQPPLFSTVSLNEKDTASAIPLSEGLVISQRFSKFYLSHPYADGGRFRLLLLQRDDWLERPLPPEALRFAGTHPSLISIAGRWTYFQVRNNFAGAPMSAVPDAPLAQRLIRVNQVTLCLGRNELPNTATFPPQTVLLCIAYPGEPTAAYDPFPSHNAADSRVADANFSAGMLEYCADAGAYDGCHLLLSRVFDPSRLPELIMPVDMVLSPGGRLECVVLDGVAGHHYCCAFSWTERPFN